MNETKAMDSHTRSRSASLRTTVAAALALTVGATCVTAHAVPVIPGAEGSGVSTPAGRGGAVHRVTTLNESGAGSLKACVDASGPRVCVFEVSGAIRLSDDLTIRNPFLTIAGQTAPSPGIMLRNAGILVKTSDVLIQHIRVRPGDDASGEPYINRDALKIESAGAQISNIVIDHCSFSWATDEIASAWANWNNLALLNNIFAEPLHESLHPEGAHGFGVLFGPVSGSVTLAGNLMAHMQSRNPMTAATRAAVVNNVVYNWGGSAMDFQNRGLTSLNSVIGNVFIAGANTGAPNPIGLRADEYKLLSGSKLYLNDNFAGTPDVDDWSLTWTIKGSLTPTSFRASTPVAWPAGLTTRPTAANVVRDHVLKYAGARPADRDSADRRIVDSVRTRTGQIINCVSANGTPRCQKNAGGWPTLAANKRTLTLPANHNAMTDSGYTNLELWLHRKSAEVEGRHPTPPAPPTLAAGD